MGMVRGEFVGYRPCPARAGYVELVIRIEQKRLNWCVPAGTSDTVSDTDFGGDSGGQSDTDFGTVAEPAPERLELRWHHSGDRSGVQLVGVRPADELPVSGTAAVELLAGGQLELLVDDRLIALHQ